MERLEFYKELYNNEIDRKNSYGTDISFAVTLLTAVAGIFAYIIKSFDFISFLKAFFSFSLNANYCWVLGYLLLFIISAGLIIFATFYLMKAYRGVEYSILPTANELDTYYRELLETFKEANPDGDEKIIEDFVNQQFDNYIENLYRDLSTFNASANSKKDIYLGDFRKYFIYSLIATFISFATLAKISYLYPKEDITKVKIIGYGKD